MIFPWIYKMLPIYLIINHPREFLRGYFGSAKLAKHMSASMCPYRNCCPFAMTSFRYIVGYMGVSLACGACVKLCNTSLTSILLYQLGNDICNEIDILMEWLLPCRSLCYILGLMWSVSFIATNKTCILILMSVIYDYKASFFQAGFFQ